VPGRRLIPPLTSACPSITMILRWSRSFGSQPAGRRVAIEQDFRKLRPPGRTSTSIRYPADGQPVDVRHRGVTRQQCGRRERDQSPGRQART
jgi:hypothetical protein